MCGDLQKITYDMLEKAETVCYDDIGLISALHLTFGSLLDYEKSGVMS